VLATVVAAGLCVAANVAADIYGLFRDPAHRALGVYGDERIAKYLLSTRYVHANFDGVLIGSSVSANWATGKMHSARLYNESINGGNIVEEKAILDRLLERPGTRMVLMVVHPYLTDTHQFNTVELAPREAWGALGSQNLLEAYKAALKIRLGREQQIFDAWGTANFGDQAKKLNPHLQRMMRPGGDFEIDPIARQAWRDVVADLHARHIPIAFVVPPVSEPIFAAKRDGFLDYTKEMLAPRQPGDPLLDCGSDQFADLRADLRLYTDGVHLHAAAAARFAAILDAQLEAWIAQGWLKHD